MYQIINWRECFENDRSRTTKALSWIKVPNKRGLGLKRLLAKRNGPALFGCFVLIVEACSRHIVCDATSDRSRRDGWLTVDGHSNGRPWDVEDLSIETGCPRDIVTETLTACCEDRIGWMREVDSLGPPLERGDSSENGRKTPSVASCDGAPVGPQIANPLTPKPDFTHGVIVSDSRPSHGESPPTHLERKKTRKKGESAASAAAGKRRPRKLSDPQEAVRKEFISWFCVKAYPSAMQGVEYPFDGANDGKAVMKLLGHPWIAFDIERAKLVALAYLRADDVFIARQNRPLSLMSHQLQTWVIQAQLKQPNAGKAPQGVRHGMRNTDGTRAGEFAESANPLDRAVERQRAEEESVRAAARERFGAPASRSDG